MNVEILKALKTQLTQISGMISLVEFNLDDTNISDDAYWIKQSNAELVGLIQGLNIIIDHSPTEEEHHNETIDC